MRRTEEFRFRVDMHTKEQVLKILEEEGITASQFFNMVIKQVLRTKRIPFEFKMPNQQTTNAMEDIEAGNGVISSHDEFVEILKNA